MPTYSVPHLPYDYADLEPHLTARIVELHHNKHHRAYVDGAHLALDKIADARDRGDFSALVGLEKTLAFNVSGHVLHSLYWENLHPDGGGEPTGELGNAITCHFGNFAAFRDQMTQATTTVQGSGWSALVWEPIGCQLVVEQIYDHQSNVVLGAHPLLVIDAWEHAYYLQYENRRADYAHAIWNVINWKTVAERFADVTSS